MAFLVDGAAYFSAVRDAILRAQRSVLLVGWDFDTQVPLVPEEAPQDGFPSRLLTLLNAVLRRRPELHVHLLAWDYSFIYTFEREPLPAIKFGWRGHRRLHYALDDAHPLGASHHQKVVVIDDRVAFAGGMDLTFARWDTSEHLARDPRRADPTGAMVSPMHDVQVAVDGETAQALGELVRERWRRATGETLEPPASDEARARGRRRASEEMPGDPWPPGVAADMGDVAVGIARTVPALNDSGSEVQEILALTVRAVAAARRSLYIENQYLTSAAFGGAVAARLEEPDGPEVLIVVPRTESGWLEQSSMGVMRERLLARLHASDRHGRFRVFHPVVPGLGPSECLNVHSKVLIVDDVLLKVGSANLSNRSMGLDTECDLAIEADSPRLAAGIAAFRNRLLAEHLGVARDEVDKRIAETASLAAAVESLRGGARTLEPHTVRAGPPAVDLAGLEELVADPEKPLGPEKLMEQFVPRGLRRPARRSLAGYALLLGLVAVIAMVWLWTPLRDLLALEKLVAFGRALRDNRAGPLLAIGVFVIGGLLFFPVTPLIAASALVFGPLRGSLCALIGALASASVTYSLGRLLGRPVAERLLTPRLRSLREQLRRRSFIAIVSARVLPVGSFTLINIVAGALLVRFRPFLLGNFVGLLPGILGMSLFANRLGDTIANPSAGNVFALLGLAALIVAALALASRALARARIGGPKGRRKRLSALREVKET